MIRTISLAISFLTILHCATINANHLTKDEEYHDEGFFEYLNSIKGILSYDQALKHFGEPYSIFQGDEIFIATGDTKSLKGAVFSVSNALCISLKKWVEITTLF